MSDIKDGCKEGFNLVVHYEKEDLSRSGDYLCIELFLRKVPVNSWGDAYHDKGLEKAYSFIEGFNAALKLFEPKALTINRIDVADGKTEY